MTNGGSAFPIATSRIAFSNGDVDYHEGQDGMTLRDYFAAQALPSTLSASSHVDGCYDYVAAAVGAYQVADAMIAEREK